MGIFGPDSNEPTSGATPQGAIAQIGEMLKKLAAMRGGQQAPQSGGGTPAQIGRVFDPNNPQSQATPVFSTPPPAAVAPNPGAPSPLLGQMGTWFPNAKAKSGATALSAVDSVAQAITGFKQKRDSDNITKAQNSLNMFTNALQKGDMQVANLLASDPKIVKSWEKYLKMEMPRVPGGQTGPDGKPQLGPLNQPGGIAATRDTTAELLQNLAIQNEEAKRKVQEEQAFELHGSGEAYRKEANVYAANAKAIPLKTAADIEQASAATQASLAAARLSDAKTATETIDQGDIHGLNTANISAMNAQAAYALAHAKYEEVLAGLGGYTPVELGGIIKRDLQGLYTQRTTFQRQFDELQKKMQSKTADLGVKVLSKTGITSSYEEDAKKAKASLDGLDKAIRTYSGLQDQVMNGKLKPSAALQQAYEAGGINTDIQMDAPPVELLKEGTVSTMQDGSDWTLSNGQPVMVHPAPRANAQ